MQNVSCVQLGTLVHGHDCMVTWHHRFDLILTLAHLPYDLALGG